MFQGAFQARHNASDDGKISYVGFGVRERRGGQGQHGQHTFLVDACLTKRLRVLQGSVPS